MTLTVVSLHTYIPTNFQHTFLSVTHNTNNISNQACTQMLPTSCLAVPWHASYNHHGDEVAHQSDLAYGQQYEEEGEHMVLEDQSQACMMDQQHQHQHLAPQELYMQGLQYEACQRQYSQQDEMMVMNESEQENVAPNGQLLCQASSQSHSWVRQNAVTPEPPAGAQEQYQTQCSGQAAVIAISTLKSSLAAMQKRTICSLVHQNDLLGRHFATQLLCCLKVSCILCIC